MPNCDKAEVCPFFNETADIVPTDCAMYKDTYCLGNFMRCARHMVCLAKGKDAVPGDLFPNQKEKALGLIYAHAEC